MQTPITAVALIFLSLASFAAHAAPEESFDLRVPTAPMARAVEGGSELVYELHLDNYARQDLQPVQVEVLDAASGRVLAAYAGEALDQRLDRSGVQWKGDTYTAIPSGRRGVVFIELTLTDALPRSLRHRLHYQGGGAEGDARRIEGGDTAVIAGKTPVLSPPLRGGPWVAIYDARWERGHRRVGYAIGGRLHTPGRYAVDWVKLDANGRKAPEGNDLATGTYSYGQPVLAVADGVVTRVSDSFPERERLSQRPTGNEGNSLVLDIGNGRYAHYGHLRPGSAKIAAGTRVKAGDTLAEVGFSGSASDPQLHFSLTDGPEELASEGVAYMFDRYRVLGRFAEMGEVGAGVWKPSGAAEKQTKAAMPAGMRVLQWRE